MSENNHKITVNNFNNFSTVCYSVVLLKGEISSNINSKCNPNNIISFQISNNNNESPYTSPVNNNKFKQVIQLILGVNEIKIQYCCSSTSITLNFAPKLTKYCVVPIYIVCKNHDGTFQSPSSEDNSISSACNRISSAAKLIQCLFAEKFYENALDRKTFQIESDINPNAPICRVFYSNFDVESVRIMRQDEMWYNFGRELMSSEHANTNHKYLAFVSCTWYKGDNYSDHFVTHDDIVSLTEAHAALGGGGLAIFGSACLHTWPTSIKNVVKCFENETKIDKTQFMDDSCYRGTFGGCFATTLGSVCHELCHTFDLGHTDEGIMGRGFDEINKEFTIAPLKTKSKVQKEFPSEKQHCTVLFTPNINVKITQNVLPITKRLNPHPIKSNSSHNKRMVHSKNGIYWTRSCTIFLYYHRWLNEVYENEHSLNYEDMAISSSAGICVVEIRNEISGLVLKWWDFSDKPKFVFEIDKDTLPNDFNDEDIVIVAEDVIGNIIKQKL